MLSTCAQRVVVTIGRTLRSFPRSKRGRRVSSHHAFRFGLRIAWLQAGDWSDRRRRAPAIVPTDHRHRLSLVHPLNQRSEDFSWQTFTVSWPLPPGIWLLCCLRPLSHSLAFSRPFRARWCESSPVPNEEVIVTRSCLLYAGRTREQSLVDWATTRTAAVPFWPGCLSLFHPFRITTLQQVPAALFTP